MAPFKLKFRMGSSRSTSQEVDADPQANQALLQNTIVTGIGASCSTLDSADCNSLGSLANDQRSLLPNCSNTERIGYMNPGIIQTSDNSIPNSPPPSYEHVLEENRLANLDRDSNLTPTRTLTGGGSINGTGGGGGNSVSSAASGGGGNGGTGAGNCSSVVGGAASSPFQRSSRNTSVEQITSTCTDPDCTIVNENQEGPNSRKESIDSTQCLLSTMTAPSSHDNLLECTGSCDPMYEPSSQNHIVCDDHHDQQTQDTSQNDDGEDDNQTSHHLHQVLHSGAGGDEHDDEQCQGSGDEDHCPDNDWNSSQGQHHQQPIQEQITTSEIISNKSSKEIYKAMSKQWGITCKMSDQCRCMECQSHYFDCEFDDNDHQKTDGGLGAGTPMFISEVMHGSACNIL